MALMKVEKSELAIALDGYGESDMIRAQDFPNPQY